MCRLRIIVCSPLWTTWSVYVCMTYKHRGAQVKLVEELRDKDVSLDNFLLVDLLDATQYVEQPLELALTRRHPDEVHLHSTQ